MPDQWIIITHDRTDWGARFLVFLGVDRGVVKLILPVQSGDGDDYEYMAGKVVKAFTAILAA